VRSVVALTLVGVVACGSSSSSSPANDGGSSTTGDGAPGSTPPLSQPQQGVATYYDATGAGACSFDASPNDLDVAAMDAPEWNGSAPCGECVSVQGPKGNVTVRIVDLCPGCEKGHLDLSQQAFAKIADVSAGRVPITWTVVPCNVTGNVSYRYKDGTSQWWTAIQVLNHRLPIAKMEWKHSGAWEEIPRQDYNYFVVQSGVGTGSVDVRITASTGATLEDTLPAAASGVTATGAAQL
jgi:expansin (peptidoglycan-binding protein)